MSRKPDLAILAPNSMFAKHLVRAWGIGVFPYPYMENQANAMITDSVEKLISLDRSFPVVLFSGDERGLFYRPARIHAAIDRIAERGMNMLDVWIYDGKPSRTLEDVLAKREFIFKHDLGWVWVIKEDAHGN